MAERMRVVVNSLELFCAPSATHSASGSAERMMCSLVVKVWPWDGESLAMAEVSPALVMMRPAYSCGR